MRCWYGQLVTSPPIQWGLPFGGRQDPSWEVEPDSRPSKGLEFVRSVHSPSNQTHTCNSKTDDLRVYTITPHFATGIHCSLVQDDDGNESELSPVLDSEPYRVAFCLRARLPEKYLLPSWSRTISDDLIGICLRRSIALGCVMYHSVRVWWSTQKPTLSVTRILASLSGSL